MAEPTLAEAMQRNQEALDAMVKGDCSAYVGLLSARDDVTWGNPFGPFARGRAGVEATLARAAARMQGGRALPCETLATYASDDLAVVVAVEHAEMQAAGSTETTHSQLRVTSVFRREAAGWVLVHRHADRVVAPT